MYELVKTSHGKHGGSGGIRTHGPREEPSVFKTGAINRTLPHFHIGAQGGTRTRKI